MATNCPKCGTLILLDDRFCRACGTDIKGSDGMDECIECKVPVQKGKLYCEKCEASHRGNIHSQTRDISVNQGQLDASRGSYSLPGSENNGLDRHSGDKILVGTGDVDNSKHNTYILPTAPAPTPATTFLNCDYCGSHVAQISTFKCGNCGINLCNSHKDHKHLVCIKCAEVKDKEEEEKRRATRTSSYVPSPDPIQELYANLAGLSNPMLPFNIQVWTDRKSYRIGDILKINFRSDVDCYLWLLDLGTSGKLFMIYPNPYVPDNLLRGGKTYSLPDERYDNDFKWIINPPTGIERVKAIATVQYMSTPGLAALKSDMAFSPMQESGRICRDIGIQTRKLPPSGWATTMCEFAVEK
jgi:hypothetical protein